MNERMTTNLFGLTQPQLEMFEDYAQLLLEWNKRINLTRIVEPDEIMSKHFLDSLSLYPILAERTGVISLIDVGTGAGFPGIPLKIVRPDLRLTLLESTGKKTKFLSHVVKMLGLQDVIIVTARAEEAGQNPAHRQRYDVAVARAVAKLPVLVEYLLPLVRTGGMMIAQKGQHPQDELNMAQRAIGMLGGASPKIQNVVVPGIEADRHLVIIKKQKSTRKQYPRRPGVPNKEPL